MAPVRILTYLPRLAAIGGVELHMLQLTRELAGRGDEIDLLYTADGDLTAAFTSFCHSVARAPAVTYGNGPLRDVRGISRGAWAAARAKPDLIYANNLSEMAWAGSAKLLSRAPVVCHLHEFAQFRGASMTLLGRQAQRFVVASEYMRGVWSRHGLDDRRIEVIPYGIDPAEYPPTSAEQRRASRRELGLPADAYVVLYLGRFDQEKGVEVLLDAWRQLGLAPQDARLVLVGAPVRHADPAAYLLELQQQAPAGCDWLPMRPGVLDVMRAADVLVLPSVWEEPFGRVIIEAMATGCPAVASDGGGIPEILDGQFSEFLFARGDSAQLAQRLRELSDWRARRPQLAEECIARVTERYTLTRSATRMQALFTQVAGR